MRVYVCFLVFVLGSLEKVSFECWNIFIHFSFILYDCINDLFHDLYDCLLKILGRTFVRCYTFTKDTYTL